jgi:hypothetical protein
MELVLRQGRQVRVLAVYRIKPRGITLKVKTMTILILVFMPLRVQTAQRELLEQTVWVQQEALGQPREQPPELGEQVEMLVLEVG